MLQYQGYFWLPGDETLWGPNLALRTYQPYWLELTNGPKVAPLRTP